MNLKVGAIIGAAIMGVISEIGSQFVSQKWDEIAEQKNLPKTLRFGGTKDDKDDKEEDTTD